MVFTIKTVKTQRVFHFGNPEKAKHLIIVFHGYGQLPEYFIRKFHSLDPEKYFIVAPEGLHRFYLSGTSGRVGASWMTKEAREDDISDNIDYLNEVSKNALKQGEFTKRTIIGFSQGGATAARWHQNGNFKADNFVFWASVFPPDLVFSSSNTAFERSSNFFIVGNDDPYFQNVDLNSEVLIDKHFPVETEKILFSGKHDITKEALELLLSKL